MTFLTEGKTSLVLKQRFSQEFDTRGNSFAIVENKKLKKKIPALGVRDLIVFGDANISAKVFHLASKNNIPIHFLDGNGVFKGSARFDFSKNVFLRHAQFLHYHDKTKKLFLAKKFVQAKVNNQNTVLQKLRLKGRLNKEIIAKNLESLRGEEGSRAQQYFRIWQDENIFKIDLQGKNQFRGRVKNPPTDPINAMLSFCYIMMNKEILSQLSIAGLDPYIGYLHEQTYGHAALASDFVEPWRGVIEHFVIKSFNLREFSVDDFEFGDGDFCKLNKDGFQVFFPKWVKFLRIDKFHNDLSLVATIERDVRKFVHFLSEDISDFNFYHWKK